MAVSKAMGGVLAIAGQPGSGQGVVEVPGTRVVFATVEEPGEAGKEKDKGNDGSGIVGRRSRRGQLGRE